MDSLRGSSVKFRTMQRRLAWPLRKDDTHTHTHKSRDRCRRQRTRPSARRAPLARSSARLRTLLSISLSGRERSHPEKPLRAGSIPSWRVPAHLARPRPNTTKQQQLYIKHRQQQQHTNTHTHETTWPTGRCLRICCLHSDMGRVDVGAAKVTFDKCYLTQEVHAHCKAGCNKYSLCQTLCLLLCPRLLCPHPWPAEFGPTEAYSLTVALASHPEVDGWDPDVIAEDLLYLSIYLPIYLSISLYLSIHIC